MDPRIPPLREYIPYTILSLNEGAHAPNLTLSFYGIDRIENVKHATSFDQCVQIPLELGHGRSSIKIEHDLDSTFYHLSEEICLDLRLHHTVCKQSNSGDIVLIEIIHIRLSKVAYIFSKED